MTRRTFNTLAPAGIAAAVFTQTGCQSALDWLELAVGALEYALPLIAPAAGIPPAIVTMVSSYLGGVSQAITEASTILQSTQTPAQKAVAIAAAFAGIVAPLVPSQYSALAAAIAKIVQYVANFLTSTANNATAKTATLSTANMTRVQSIRLRAINVHNAVRR
jgi:hypothetical protein